MAVHVTEKRCSVRTSIRTQRHSWQWFRVRSKRSLSQQGARVLSTSILPGFLRVSGCQTTLEPEQSNIIGFTVRIKARNVEGPAMAVSRLQFHQLCGA